MEDPPMSDTTGRPAPLRPARQHRPGTDLVPLTAAGRSGPATGLVLPRGRSAPDGADPVFVLCTGRSGSTLLRFVLDAHPELACPPETRLPWLATQLANAWSVLTDSPPQEDDAGPAEFAQPVIEGLRLSLTPMIDSYLAKRGKTRY